MLQAGDIVDRYEVEAHIGEGGMASVYRVRHTLLGSLHAMKVLRRDLVRDEDIRQRFLSEGRIQAQLHHPYIAAVTDLVSVEGVAGLVMEYLEGCTLADRIDRGEALVPREAMEVFGPVLAAVEHAHVHGVVHRDLKPSNVFLCSRTTGMVRPVVLDFGIAKLKQNAAVTAFRSRETHAGARMGTVQYMSPEQVRSAATVDSASDIYSLAVMLIELLTGKLLHVGDNDFDVMRSIVEGERVPVRQLLPTQPALAKVLETALAHDADQRPACGEFRRALEEAVSHEPAPARPAKAAPQPVPARRPTWSDAEPQPAPEPKTTGPMLIKMPGTDFEETFEITSKRVVVDEARGRVLQNGEQLGRQTHALLRLGRSGWTIEACGSGRVVEVNGELVKGIQPLESGSALFVGLHVFRFIA